MKRDTIKLIAAALIVLAIDVWGLTSLAISIANGQEHPATWEVTAYACPPHCGQTASGAQVGPGSIAAPWWVPFGTVLYVEGYGYGVVTDRGGAIYGNRLDVWLPSHGDAIQWGRRSVDVWWVSE